MNRTLKVAAYVVVALLVLQGAYSAYGVGQGLYTDWLFVRINKLQAIKKAQDDAAKKAAVKAMAPAAEPAQ